MRVGFFHPQFKHVGGAEVLIAAQAQYLRGAGHDVRVISHMRDPQRWKNALEGISLCDFDALAFRWSDFYRSKAERLARSVARTEAQLDRCDVTVAHNFPSCALLGAATTQSRRIWYCNEPHRRLHLITANPRLYGRVTSQEPQSGAERSYAHKLASDQARVAAGSARNRLRQFDRDYTGRIEVILANSEYTRENVLRTYGRSDVQVVHPIVDFPAPSRSRTGRDRTRGLQVLAHSRLDALKNLEHVLRGFAIYGARACGAQLHIVGEGDERKRLGKLALRLGLGTRVHFHGFLSHAELARVYDACDVFALTPIDEPFGMVFPEAAARGLLLIGPDHAGPFEIMGGGELGFTCDPFDPEALAETLSAVAALSDGDIDRRRERADYACRSRYAASAIGPRLLRACS